MREEARGDPFGKGLDEQDWPFRDTAWTASVSTS